MNLQEGYVFSCVCVCVCSLGVPCDHYPSWIDFAIQGPKPQPRLFWLPEHGILTVHNPLIVTSGGHDWRPVQTCSLEDPPHWSWYLVATEADIWWLLKHVNGPNTVVRVFTLWWADGSCIPLECLLIIHDVYNLWWQVMNRNHVESNIFLLSSKHTPTFGFQDAAYQKRTGSAIVK